jgi:hypothetical protein
MRTFPYRYDEGAFLAALTTGRDQSHRLAGLDPRADRAMARYVLAHVHRSDAILTDDAQTFGVVLLSGRPDLFVDQIDHGDARWLQAAEHPYRKVRFLLISDIAIDLLNRMYPHPRRGLDLLYATRTSRLYAVVGAVH